MMTLTCSLTTTNGETLTGRISASTPYDNIKPEFTGPVELLGPRTVKMQPADMSLLFKAAARRLGVEFTQDIAGEYDFSE